MQGEASPIDTEEAHIGLIRRGQFSFPDGSQYDGDFLTVPVPTFVRVESAWFLNAQGNNKKPPAPPAKDKTTIIEEIITPLPPTTVLRHGKGRYACQASGCLYDGDWMMDMPHGQGVLVYEDGTKYTGAFKENELHGKGEYVWPDKSKCTTEFVNGIPEGNIVYVDGPKEIVSWSGVVENGVSSRLNYAIL